MMFCMIWDKFAFGVSMDGRKGDGVRGPVGVKGNYLSYPSNSVISSGLAIRFTDAVVISGNRATKAPAYPNFRTVSLVLIWPQFIPHPIKPCSL